MEIGLLRTFVTVVRLGSFSAAAQELGYTQSAVSQQIAALEHDLGVALLHRRPVAAPRLVHRVDLVHGSLTDAAAAMVAELRRAAGDRAA